jgi:hypothetical protein
VNKVEKEVYKAVAVFYHLGAAMNCSKLAKNRKLS